MTAISSGQYFSCAVQPGQPVRCWGAGTNGQIGDGGVYNRYVSTLVSGLSNVTSVATGEACVRARARRHRQVLGLNANGQLGDGTTTQRTTPVAVSGILNAVAIAAGQTHACARLADNTVKCWGNNASGQLGDGTNVQKTTPVAVST
ncbi:MAG: hypothetical protein U0359_02625 [Byssovorax sp.]